MNQKRATKEILDWAEERSQKGEAEAQEDTKKGPKRKLKPRERAFLRAYIENGGNGTQAAITAGYAERSAGTTAYRLLNREYILEEYQRMLDAGKLSDLWITEQIKQHVVSDDPNVSLRALEDLAKIRGMFKDKLDITGQSVEKRIIEFRYDGWDNDSGSDSNGKESEGSSG